MYIRQMVIAVLAFFWPHVWIRQVAQCPFSPWPARHQASVDSRVIVRELREETMELRRLPQLGLDDGVGLWRHLRLVLMI